MNKKKYLKILFLLIVLFILYHMGMWIFFTSKIFNLEGSKVVGDLGRMSYQTKLLTPREFKYTLKKQHLNKDTYKNQKIDLLTIGDSFSNAAAGGFNPYYQDYIATNLDINILNINKYKNLNSLETIVGLYNSGVLSKLKPKIILIESVERLIHNRYAKKIDFTTKINLKDISELLSSKVVKSNVPNLLMINTANYKMAFYFIKYKYINNAVKEVYKFKLHKNMFSSEIQDELLVLRDDVKNASLSNKGNITIINDNFNTLSIILKKLDIKLIFMPVVDKYDLYHEYM